MSKKLYLRLMAKKKDKKDKKKAGKRMKKKSWQKLY